MSAFRTGRFALAAALAAAAPGVLAAQQVAAPDTAAIPLGRWDDDWWHPEGVLRLGGKRYSIMAGVTVTRFKSGATRAAFGAGQLSPNIELYRPEHRGLSPSLNLSGTSSSTAGARASYLALTGGARYQFVDSDRRHRVVPFLSAGVGPYFTRTSLAGRNTVFGATGAAGLDVSRAARLEVRYNYVARAVGQDLSTIAAGISIRVPPFASRRARHKMTDDPPPLGAMVDVGGHRLHIVCAGTGSPPVVFEAGVGDAWVVWEQVMVGLAPTTRVCAYDRAGVAWSDAAPGGGGGPRTSRQIAAELHRLLERAGVAGPYIMVGHSLGGLNVRSFAALYPGDVAGMVLVDATHEDLVPGTFFGVRAQDAEYAVKLDRMARDAERAGSPVVPNLPPAVASRPAWHRARMAELAGAEESARFLRSGGRSLVMPLTVITGARSAREGTPRAVRSEMAALWDSLQADLARLSPAGRRVIATRSGHYVQRDEPDVVVAAVRQMVETVRR